MQRLADTDIPKTAVQRRNERKNKVKQDEKWKVKSEDMKTICGNSLAFVLRTPRILKQSKRLQTKKRAIPTVSFVQEYMYRGHYAPRADLLCRDIFFFC